jgi:signal transduction histidine kinase
VTDDGPGIEPHVREHLFDPFYSGREAGRGLGFGLPKCWRIAELHGGKVEVRSESGQGTTFRLVLPSNDDLMPAERS